VFRFFGNAVGRWQKGKEIAAKRRKMESVELGAGGIEPEEEGAGDWPSSAERLRVGERWEQGSDAAVGR